MSVLVWLGFVDAHWLSPRLEQKLTFMHLWVDTSKLVPVGQLAHALVSQLKQDPLQEMHCCWLKKGLSEGHWTTSEFLAASSILAWRSWIVVPSGRIIVGPPTAKLVTLTAPLAQMCLPSSQMVPFGQLEHLPAEQSNSELGDTQLKQLPFQKKGWQSGHTLLPWADWTSWMVVLEGRISLSSTKLTFMPLQLRDGQVWVWASQLEQLMHCFVARLKQGLVEGQERHLVPSKKAVSGGHVTAQPLFCEACLSIQSIVRPPVTQLAADRSLCDVTGCEFTYVPSEDRACWIDSPYCLAIDESCCSSSDPFTPFSWLILVSRLEVELTIEEASEDSSWSVVPFRFWQVQLDSLRGTIKDLDRDPSCAFCLRIACSKSLIFSSILVALLTLD